MSGAKLREGEPLERWRRAARIWSAMREVRGRPRVPSPRLRRLLLEVEGEEGTELLMASLLEGRLHVRSEREAPSPGAVALLEELLGAKSPRDAAGTSFEEGGGRFSVPPPEAPSPPRHRAAGWPVEAGAIEEVSLAVGRAGVRGALRSPAFQDAVQHLAEQLGPEAVGARRWVGRLRNALAACDAQEVAGLLAAALRFVDSVGTQGGVDEVQAVWTGHLRHRGTSNGAEQVLLELGRERLDGLERDELEQRYLWNPERGALFVEVFSRRGGSAGPVPRVLRVGLAESGPSPSGPRLRLLQYAVSLGSGEADWDSVASSALQDFGAVLDAYRRMERQVGRLAEPVALIAPLSLEDGESGAVRPLDRHGRGLPLVRTGRGEVEALRRAVGEGARVRWILGRLLVRGGALRLRLVSAGIQQGDRSRLLRLR